ncbi:MAG: BON domain-containing protein [Oligoflexia bacterium]|nr:BON domain-containing protein [Oligoflexia bacterium]
MKALNRFIFKVVSIVFLAFGIYFISDLFLTTMNLYASKMDEQIETMVKDSFVFRNYLKNDDIEVSTKNGVVTLTGTVKREMNKYLAQKAVEELGGVKKVDNFLKIK